MSTFPMRSFGVLLLIAAWPAHAQVSVLVQAPVPMVRFEVAPPLVVVAPGVQVVEDYGEEVFFVDGWYWLRTEGRWYRSLSHHGQWALVPAGVPAHLVALPPGHYKHWKRTHAREARPVRHRGKGKKH